MVFESDFLRQRLLHRLSGPLLHHGCHVAVGSLTRRFPRPDLAVGLEYLDHHLPLGLVLPEVPEQPFLVGVVLPYALKATLHEPLDVGGVEGDSQVSTHNLVQPYELIMN